MTIRILLADDHKIIRDGLRSLLRDEPDLEVVGEADDGQSAVELAAELQPDVVVMDVGMPKVNGIDATRAILKGLPDARVIALSMHRDRESISRMVQAGAAGYLLKSCAYEELAAAVHAVAEGGTYFSQKIAAMMIRELWLPTQYAGNVNNAGSHAADPLSAREQEVLIGIAQGRNSKEIGLELDISAKTVDAHRRRIMEKLNLFRLADLIKYAINKGYTSLDS